MDSFKFVFGYHGVKYEKKLRKWPKKRFFLKYFVSYLNYLSNSYHKLLILFLILNVSRGFYK